MSWVLEIKDKSGRRIHLSKERWSHIQKHPNMSDKIEQIKETLTNPQAITEFEYDPDVRFYFRYYKKRKEYLFVSVKYVKNHPSEMGGMISSASLSGGF